MMYYQIVLKPLGSFYFGAENSFGSSKSSDEKENYFAKGSAYFAKGEMFPQQTQVLGMLRKEILKQKYLKYYKNDMWVTKGNREKASKLVGNRWTPDSELELGKIKQLSPLYLLKQDKLYIPSPLNKGLKLQKVDGKSIINDRKDENFAYRFIRSDGKYFGAKDYLCSSYMSADNTVELDEIFTKSIRTGNQTLGYTQDEEEQLYKMQSYCLDKDFSFVFYLTCKEKFFKDDIYKSTVELGGERSRFAMTATVIEKLPEFSKIYKQDNQDSVILLSDSLVDSSIFKYCKVSLADKVPFRTIFNRKSFSKTEKVILLKKGSVFYPKDEQAKENIITMIEAKNNFRVIGYNQYLK